MTEVRWALAEDVVPEEAWIESLDGFECWWSEFYGWLEDGCAPTHWMPLPEPPAFEHLTSPEAKQPGASADAEGGSVPDKTTSETEQIRG